MIALVDEDLPYIGEIFLFFFHLKIITFENKITQTTPLSLLVRFDKEHTCQRVTCNFIPFLIIFLFKKANSKQTQKITEW